jgi:hypothetical protein
VPIRIFSKWSHHCHVVQAKQAAMQITYGTCQSDIWSSTVRIYFSREVSDSALLVKIP